MAAYLEQALRLMTPCENITNCVEFNMWFNEFEYVASTISVPINKMVEFFTTMVNNDIHMRVKERYSFLNFSELPYRDIKTKFLHYFNGDINVHIPLFYCRHQYNEETILQYARNLSEMLNRCNFNEKDKISILKHKFIQGIRDCELKEYLILLSNLSYSDIMTEATEFLKSNRMTYYLEQASPMINTFSFESGDTLIDWLNKFDYVADSIGVPDNKMIEFFNKMVSNNVHTYVKRKAPTVKIFQFTYNQIINHYLIVIYSSNADFLNKHRIMTRIQYKKETIQSYANNLRKIFSNCINTISPRELCQQFVEGLRENDIQNHLRSINGLLFEEMVSRAIQFYKFNSIAYYVDQAVLKMNKYNLIEPISFYNWLNRFEHVADSIDVPDDKMIEFFNKMVDNNAHKKVRKTYPNLNFSNLSYEQIIEHYYLCFTSVDEIDINHYRFISRKQYEQESIEEYAFRLKKLFMNCFYQNRLEETLCKQFVNGIRDENLQNYLRNIPQMPFDKVLEAINFDTNDVTKHYVNQALLKIKMYDKETEGFFYAWLNKFEFEADAIRVPENTMLQFFNNMVTNNTRSFVRENLPNVNCSSPFSFMSYEGITNAYLYVFSANKERYLHRIRFFARKQYDCEPIEKYAFHLKKIFNKCYFKMPYVKILCEQFYNGIRENDIKIHLCESNFISFDEMVSAAITFAQSNLVTYYIDQVLLSIKKYNPKMGDTIHNWFNQFEYVTDIVNVPPGKMLELFNHMVHVSVHTFVKRTFPTLKYSELSYDIIVMYYLRSFSGSEVDSHKVRFRCRRQFKEETIEQYANNLQKIYSMCDPEKCSNEELCNQFINGLAEDSIRNHLCPYVSRGLLFNQIVAKANQLLNN